MKATAGIYLDVRKKNKDEKYYVKIRVTHMRVQKYYPTDISLNEPDYDKVMARTPKGKDKDIRIELDARLAKARAAINSIPVFTFTEFERNYNTTAKSAYDIFPVFDAIIREKKAIKKPKTASIYQTAVNSLTNFKSKIGFYDVNARFLQEYQQWMIDNGKSLTSISMYLRCLRTVYNRAMKDGIVRDSSLYPFKTRGFVIPAGRNTKKALTKEEIRLVAEFENLCSSIEEYARDMWIFSYLSNGLNMNDIFRMKWSQIRGSYIYVVRNKTVNTGISAVLPITIYIGERSRQS